MVELHSVSDCLINKTIEDFDELVWVIYIHQMSGVLHSEDLRLATREVTVVPHDLLCAIVRCEEVLIAIDVSNREFDVWVAKAVFSGHVVFDEARRLQ